jgi:POT family proton-dependent oligopeptide transporter
MAQYAAGIVAQFTSSETVGGAVLDPHASLQNYLGVFQTIGLFAVGVSVVLFVLWPFLKKGMHGVK